MKTAATNDRLSIAAASLRLRKSYGQVRRLVLIGELEGGPDADGRWYVQESSVREQEKRAGKAGSTRTAA